MVKKNRLTQNHTFNFGLGCPTPPKNCIYSYSLLEKKIIFLFYFVIFYDNNRLQWLSGISTDANNSMAVSSLLSFAGILYLFILFISLLLIACLYREAICILTITQPNGHTCSSLKLYSRRNQT